MITFAIVYKAYKLLYIREYLTWGVKMGSSAEKYFLRELCVSDYPLLTSVLLLSVTSSTPLEFGQYTCQRLKTDLYS